MPESSYLQLSPCHELKDVVDSYWEHKNPHDEDRKMVIFPDSFFKLIVVLIEGEISSLFVTGLWPQETEYVTPANATIYGIRFNVLAPEYIFQREIASLLQSQSLMDHDFWGINNFRFDNLEEVVAQFEAVMMEKLQEKGPIEAKKHHLSHLLYQAKGSIGAEELTSQVAWSHRQINRYLNKFIGVSLKKYINIQKCYTAYIQIREGKFFPEKDYFDQPHFIREVKKHTGHTPKELYKDPDDQFIQLRNIQED